MEGSTAVVEMAAVAREVVVVAETEEGAEVAKAVARAVVMEEGAMEEGVTVASGGAGTAAEAMATAETVAVAAAETVAVAAERTGAEAMEGAETVAAMAASTAGDAGAGKGASMAEEAKAVAMAAELEEETAGSMEESTAGETEAAVVKGGEKEGAKTGGAGTVAGTGVVPAWVVGEMEEEQGGVKAGMMEEKAEVATVENRVAEKEAWTEALMAVESQAATTGTAMVVADSVVADLAAARDLETEEEVAAAAQKAAGRAD